MSVATATSSTFSDSVLPTGWAQIGTGSYARRLVGYELAMHKYGHCAGQHGNWAMGLKFTSQLPDLVEAFTQALIHLRVFAPLLASGISTPTELAGEPCWTYKPLASYEEAYRWARATLHVHDPAPSNDDFLTQVNQTLLPYEPLPGHKQYIACHLLLRPDGTHTVYLHGSHAVLEGQTVMWSFRRMLESLPRLNAPSADAYVWGAEVANLPVDVLHAVRVAPGDTKEFDVPEPLRMSEMGLGLIPQRDTAQLNGRAVIAACSLDSETSRSVIAALRVLGLGVAHLLDAAMVLSIISLNRPLPQDAHVTLPVQPIALQRFLKPEHPASSYISSCMANVPIVIPLRDVPLDGSPRDQLLAVMHILKAQYEYWLAQPDLLLAKVLGANAPSVKANPYGPSMSNFGRIEGYLRRAFTAKDGGEELLKVQGALCGFRLVQDEGGCGGHAWSLGGELQWQIQGRDVYDQDYFDIVLQRMAAAMRALVEEKS